MRIRDIAARGLFLCALGALPTACGGMAGGGGGGGRSADAIATSGAERTRMRAALEVLGRELGHPVDVRVDAALVDGNPFAPVRVATLVEELAREVASVNPASPSSCRSGCSPATVLATMVDARSLWATVRLIELRYDASPPTPNRQAVAFEPSTGALTFRVRPDGLLSAIDTFPARRQVFYRALEGRFRGRPHATITAPELPAYVFFLTHAIERVEEARNTVPLVYVVPRLTDPALSVARGQLVAARMFIDDNFAPLYGSPEIEQAWALWYRTYAPTLDERDLRAAAHLVFNRARGELPGLPAFEYALALLAAQAGKRGAADATVLACADHSRCYGPLWDYLVDRRFPDRRRRLAAALLGARSPGFVEFVALRFYEQREADKAELLSLLVSDPAAWSAAFVPALLSLNSVSEELLVATWRNSPTLRVPMLRAIASVATIPATAMPRPVAQMRFDETPVGLASRAFNRLAYVCRTPERSAFIALASQNIPPENPVWKHRLNTGGRPCEAQ